MRVSAKLTPAARTRTRTPPGGAVGSGTSSSRVRTSGSPMARKRMARMGGERSIDEGCRLGSLGERGHEAGAEARAGPAQADEGLLEEGGQVGGQRVGDQLEVELVGGELREAELAQRVVLEEPGELPGVDGE